MRVLDLFSGLNGWGAAFRDRGHQVVTLDFDPKFGADYTRDILTVQTLGELEAGGRFDVVVASPPCEKFSVMTIGRNWNRDHTPKTDAARHALAIAWHTFALIDAYAPTWYVIENPRGKLRKVAPRPPSATTWYCQWGTPYAKPTDLWTNLNGGMALGWPTCRPNAEDHELAPRGSDLGTQRRRPDGRIDTRYIRDAITRGERVIGRHIRRDGSLASTGTLAMTTSGSRAAQRSLIPPALSLAVCLACEDSGIIRPRP